MLDIIAESTQRAIDAIDVLTKVDQFYHNAWVKLIVVVSIAGFIVGIVVPAIIHWLQSHSFRLAEENILQNIREAEERFDGRIQSTEDAVLKRLMQKYDILLEEKLEAVRKTVADELEGQKKTLKEVTGQVRSEVFGYLEHLKGGLALNDKNYAAALSSYCSAGGSYLEFGMSEANLQSVLRIIAEKCLPNLDELWFGPDGIPDLASGLISLLKKLKEANKYERYTNYIEDIELQFRLAKKRKTVKKE